MEQLDGNTEEVNERMYELLDKNDDFLEMYLKTGDICPDIRKDWQIIPCMEALQFILSPESHLCESLTNEQRGFEVFNVLEGFRRRIDKVMVKVTLALI